ncbi:MAG: FAD-dependent thymidylate synthase [Anaerolineae bacterium]|nr:FAD-dependent thymidylate synthase [Anaerolineae bacterium]
MEAKIVADSISEAGKRITTMQLCYPRFIHAEFMTHRVFSRNASSSRAIPVAKMIEQVRTNPAMPIHWGKNQAGMQAKEECNEPIDLMVPQYWTDMNPGLCEFSAGEAWEVAARHASEIAESMATAGYHKQIVNRILEPFQWIHVIVTATEWDNFFELRAHKDAQPEIHELALQMKEAMYKSGPRILKAGEWHLPYVSIREERELGDYELARKVSAARCCRVSYLKHDGTKATLEEELALCDRLIGARPLHISPFEHQATPDQYLKEGKFGGTDHWEKGWLHGNLVGWIQNRKLIESQFH